MIPVENTRVTALGLVTLAKCDLTHRTRPFNVFTASGRFVGGYECIVEAKQRMKRCDVGAIVVRRDGALLSVRVAQLLVFQDRHAGRPVGAEYGEGDR